MDDMPDDVSQWCARDRHLFGGGPKQILALDGGGVRGAITIAFLERMEQILDGAAGRDVRLSDYFDLIGGTSTGAIIAGGLALGFRVRQIREFYLQRAKLAFRPRRWHSLRRLRAKFDTRGLRTEIQSIIGDCTLGDEEQLKTGLCIVTKRLDTGSTWIVTNSRRAPYWETPAPVPPMATPEFIGNKHYQLANLVRASTAAPSYFDAELLPIIEGMEPLPRVVTAPFDHPWIVRVAQAGAEYVGLRKKTKHNLDGYGLFIDGGASPYGNPALALLLVASLKPFGLKWTLDPSQLTLVSIGTGLFRSKVDYQKIRILCAATPCLSHAAISHVRRRPADARPDAMAWRMRRALDDQ